MNRLKTTFPWRRVLGRGAGQLAVPTDDAPPRSEIFSGEQIKAHGRTLAGWHRLATHPRPDRLMTRLDDNEEMLRGAYEKVAAALAKSRRISPASEWLIDNYYLIQEQIRTARLHLPKRYGRELPQLASGPGEGLPRVYHMALELIAHQDGRVDLESLTDFVSAYQTTSPLRIGELWAIPIMLRLALLENIRRVAERISHGRDEFDRADLWADRLIESAENRSSDLILVLAEMARTDPRLTHGFVAEMSRRLQGKNPGLAMPLSWIEQRLAEQSQTLEECIQLETQNQAANQVSIGNSIGSIRALAAIDWRDFVEAMSGTEQLLRGDPAHIYSSMDFATRDRYRKAVERLARQSRRSEEEVARKAIELAAAGNGSNNGQNATRRKQHVGYYLIDKGERELERVLHARLPLRQQASNLSCRLPLRLYLGLILTITLTATAAMLLFSGSELSTAAIPVWGIVLVIFIASLCASQLAVGIVNWMITWLTPPRTLPRMDYSKGIPASCRTMVVVPTMLSSEAGVADLLDDLEVRFLANHDRHLHFALITDFTDAPQETMPNDERLLEAARAGIAALNEKYSGERTDAFFLFHRPRRWNDREHRWMGYERKRGKLEEFNALLRVAGGAGGGPAERFSTIVGQTAVLPSVRFVITLDTDTELPRDSARLLVATIAHPLVRPEFDKETKRVCEGYAILQPRVAVSLPNASRSWFVKLFAGDPGLDPYTRAVSDVYQDLFQEGSFIGKGIYEVDAFQKAVEGRFPENRILSHDLIEGCHARAALVSDVQLYEDHPTHYTADVRRRHRWIRGDWQIAPWLLPRVPGPDARRISNSLSALSRWKILDNLRRSLIPAALLTWLLLGWGGMISAAAATLVLLALLLIPMLLALSVELTRKPPDFTWSQNARTAVPGMVRQLAQIGLTLLFLPYDAIVSVDAILRTTGRMLFTRRRLLEWETASESQRRASNTIAGFYRTMMAAPLLAMGLFVTLQYLHPASLAVASPLLALWAVSPLVAWLISRPLVAVKPQLSTPQQELLRRTARKTWRFFETFLDAEGNYLPPDNFQEYPAPVVAYRTSPTNIGCSLLSTLAAYDFGYIPAGDVLRRVELTMNTLEKLERYHDHFYNWYDTRTLKPLMPIYVSSVDSGNLAGMLLVLRQGLIELKASPLFPARAFGGLIDTLLIMKDACVTQRGGKPWRSLPFAPRVEGLLQELRDTPQTLSACGLLLQRLLQTAAHIRREMDADAPEDAQWARDAFERQARVLHEDLIQIAPWIIIPMASELALKAERKDQAKGTQLREMLRDLETKATLAGIANLPRTLLPVIEALLAQATNGHADERGQLLALRDAMASAAAHASTQIELIDNLATQCHILANMDFEFLFDKSRDQLSIGYNVTERRRDPSFYDLLASEARMASFVAIAQEQLPQEHWFALGRRLTTTGGRPTLLSWSGSLFEYLMPLMIMPTYEGTLLDQTYHAVVQRQIDYGKQRNVPWGISESGYNTTDAAMNYQYRAFGVPGLGYKRGLGDDLVIAPYACIMSTMVMPEQAAANMERMVEEGFMGAYGFYEAVDYTPSRLPSGQTNAIIRSFMAHHSGMSFLSLAHFMLDRPMQRRFLTDPQLRANTLLLHERVPKTAPAYPQSSEVHETRNTENGEAASAVRFFNTPHTPVPEAHLLSNGRYHVMITAAGGGTSKWNDLALTRWRSDPTRDCWGSFIYIRDLDSGEYWSATCHPTLRKPERFAVHFPQGRAEYRRTDMEIDTRLDVSVSPESDVELRRVSVTNRSRRRRRIEITSYAEVVLATAAADASHPAFSNLFVQTEILPGRQAILCTRRPRSAEERPPFMLHLMSVLGRTAGDATYETDRSRFVGRGRGLEAPKALDSGAPLSGSDGAVLDPIVSIRRVVVLEEDETAHIDYVTGIGETRDVANALIDKYRDPRLGDRLFEMAWTHSHVVLRNLDATEADAQVFGRLLSSILYPNRQRRADAAILARNRRGQSALWGYGISGDLPIVLLRMADPAKLPLVRQLMQAHAYWRMKGVQVDLVIWNEDAGGYRQGLQDQIMGMIAAGPEAHVIDRPGGIFIRRLEQIAEDDRILFQTVAAAILSDAAGTLAEQVNRRPRPAPIVPILEPAQRRNTELAPQKSAPRQLEFFNGHGGMTPDGKEYIITTDPAHPTPAPWSNVIANARIGTVISESGSGYTFVDNAHEFRLTPWSNDPVSDIGGEAFYMRDEETADVWSPAPFPTRGNHPYTSRHGFGYSVFECVHDGIRTELWIYVGVTVPVKFAVLKIDNQSGRPRRLSATGYWEWVLGDLRSKSQMHVVTEIEPRTGAMMARNSFSPDFSDRVAFVDVAEPYRTFTADREEFIGRNGTLARPLALRRVKLSGKVGAGLDPCAAIQVPFELAPGQQREIVFVMGVGQGIEEARSLVQQFRNGQAARRELEGVWDFWNRTLGMIHVETPDKAVNMLANGWLVYQTMACRMWARSGLYQSGGAYGFRDQLQDAMALLHARPLLLREHLLRAAAHQFREGDVQHWWHPPKGRGVRTHFSDDYLWLPLATARYVSATGDTGILNERSRFLDGRQVKDNEESYYDMPNPSDQDGTLYEHCVRAIERGFRYGAHGLPLIGCGDWNDGMNLIGEHGKGESVWLAFFLYHVLDEFIPLARARKEDDFAARCTEEMAKLRANIEAQAWDGNWYRRAYFDDGRPLGTATDTECQIDSLPQSWAIISGATDPSRAAQAMNEVDKRLVRREAGLIQLFDPPFDVSPLNPGYIKGYVPGVRENGGQYTHAAIWTVMAFALMGDHERAWELLTLINPLHHSATPKQIATYKVEPYVVAADIYAVKPHTGRGGWTWYTGSAGWMYRLMVETLLGIRLEVDKFFVTRVPKEWNEYRIHYRFRETLYHIHLRRTAEGETPRIRLDGNDLQPPYIPLSDDHLEHHVELLF